MSDDSLRTSDDGLRKAICRIGKMLVRRGLVHGFTGNISVRAGPRYLLTPTGSALDRLEPARLSLISREGDLQSGDPPTKEWRLHRAVYEARPSAAAVIHTHSTHSVAVSMLAGINVDDMLPVLTPYYVMRVGKCAVSPYRMPGDPQLAGDIAQLAAAHHVVVLAHHGPVVAGPSLEDAAATLEELEESARLFLLLHGKSYRTLDATAIEELRAHFPVIPP